MNCVEQAGRISRRKTPKTDFMNDSEHTGLRPWLVLTLICAFSGLLLSVTDAVAAPIIRHRAQSGAEGDRAAVFPTAQTFRDLTLPEDAPLSACAEALVRDEVAGHVGVITVNGYKGPIELTLGRSLDGTVTGLRVGGNAFMETAGLGERVKEPSFTDQFTGILPPAVLGGNVEGISGATISSGAVAAGVNKIVQYIEGLLGAAAEPSAYEAILLQAGEELPTNETVDAAYRSEAGYVVIATEKGYHGPIHVAVALDESAAVTRIAIDEGDFSETAGLGERVQEETFLSQFAGSYEVVGVRPVTASATGQSGGGDAVSGPTAGAESAYGGTDGASSATGVVEIIENADYVVDAVSGATISSTAVAKAVNRAVAYVRALQEAPTSTNTGGDPS